MENAFYYHFTDLLRYWLQTEAGDCIMYLLVEYGNFAKDTENYTQQLYFFFFENVNNKKYMLSSHKMS